MVKVARNTQITSKLKGWGYFDAYPAKEAGLSPELKGEYYVFRL